MVNFHGLSQLYSLFSLSLSVFHHSLSVYFIPFVKLTTTFLIPFVNSLSLCKILIPFIFVYHSLYLYHHSLCLITAFLIPFVNSVSLCQTLMFFLVHFLFDLTIHCLSLWHSLSVCVHGLSLLSLHDALRHGMMHFGMV